MKYVHRDIWLRNVFYSRIQGSMRFFLADFGLCIESTSKAGMTEIARHFVESAPELRDGKQRYSNEADTWCVVSPLGFALARLSW